MHSEDRTPPFLGPRKALTAHLLGGYFISNQTAATILTLNAAGVEREQMGFLFARGLRAVGLGSQYGG